MLWFRYGCNPHQAPATVLSLAGEALPFEVLNGKPGYINLLDAINAWQLVRELRTALNAPAAASFKHVSPAGAAVGDVPLSDLERRVFEVDASEQLTPSAVAYIRARGADPMCSFGDFVALSDVVDEQTALILKKEVSDGIIAPGYDAAALAILSAKKSGAFIVLRANADFVPPAVEYREIGGLVLAQRRNDRQLTAADFVNRVSVNKELPDSAVRDLLVASIAIKYTQSNSVAYALNGQTIGVGAGQQSRVDCVKLAGRKVETFHLRQHPKVLALPFKASVKRQERINARVRYIEGDFTAPELAHWLENFEHEPEQLSVDEKTEFLRTLRGVALSSDAFFPFRDNIDQASQRGVAYIAQTGGSVQDEPVTAAADEYGMVMVMTGVRLFHH
jgi:phosphoribosylaminoimidazolecarboxamide formyltransferase/IMP cyclohydrolase